eukprot:COSAG02_NODE_1055_length_14928_cov_67.022726_10_plen_423_part_00
MSATESESGTGRLPRGLERHNLAELPPGVAQVLYERDQLLWLKLDSSHCSSCADFSIESVKAQFATAPDFFSSHWSVENAVRHKQAALSPAAVLGGDGLPAGAWYCSSILQDDSDALASFSASVPFATPGSEILDAEHDDGVWLFIGANPAAANETQDTPALKKRRVANSKMQGGSAIQGRPEHTDDVDHSGTWHVQLQGSKTWYVRPQLESDEWDGDPPTLAHKTGAEKGPNGGWRLRIHVGAGEMLLINTRLWWHRTEIEEQPGGPKGLSISYARDFYLDDEDDVYGDEGEDGENDDSEDSDDNVGEDNGTCAKDALKANAPDTLDPRMRAKQDTAAGDTLLRGEEIPEGLPCSLEANCEIVEEGEHGNRVLVALRAVSTGEALAIAAREDEEYDEWELDPNTGEMVRVDRERSDTDGKA